ncbi:hypothetical protein ACDF64_05195 [Agromyces sp. MMS24-JH15]|uniref:hypothetical protein n=1 Tax=Agromyces sp. MMS24-JH15 TaxID=3243765 RepID=UPI003747BFEF
MTDFVDPLEEPFGWDRDPRGALDPEVLEALELQRDEERRAAEAATDGDDRPEPVDNLE